MNMPRCNRAGCFQNFCGTNCRLLNSTEDSENCAFFKTDEEVEKGRIWAHQELLRKERKDLIEQYEYNPHRRGMW